MTLECGKPIAESQAEVAYAASFVEFFSEQVRRINGDILPTPSENKHIFITREPVGVVAAITPWNFPAAMVTRKAAPALAAGCSMILKPAEATPLTALLLAKAAERAGMPPGVLNVVPASRVDGQQIGEVLCRDDRVRKLSFTGSTEVGKLLYRSCADSVKRMSLELGGNAPFLAFDGCNVEAAVKALMANKFRNAGQTCICTNRVLVQKGCQEEFLEVLRFEMSKLNVGHGLNLDTTIGPLISMKGKEKVEGLVCSAVAEGAQMVELPGYSETGFDGTNFYPPSLLIDVQPSMSIAREEVFGPVVSVTTFSTEEEGVNLANDTPFGLASYFFSGNTAQCFRVAGALEYGMVGVNEGLLSTAVAPFGGIKQSGIGREGSVYGVDEYLEMKYQAWNPLV
uniref:Succinate-semialdehyde dehydrogenase, mitochondrial n=2 Tax=Pinguiococcus pyrenoidosus TaxID=172671 RepID=A0A7R9UD86_9STRA|mmetsp:Transcript_6054/g.23503  ORF Transcript_6054/g.23503 Transcript_6054/m.23503 type:complete len:398 (+) Transcript_6054:599-1792(+)